MAQIIARNGVYPTARDGVDAVVAVVVSVRA
jgi:hypothetical protein